MTATAATAELILTGQSAQVQEIELERIDASLNNPRRTIDEAGLQELAASIREHGITNPLLVRVRRYVDVRFEDDSSESMGPASMAECSELLLRPGAVETDVEDRYEIICGHRRSEAATLAGLTAVPCIVRDLTDAEAAEIAIIDNLQRVDVPAMEEADAFGQLLERLGSIQAVAAKVGKEQSYVAKRLKLRTLTAWSQDALRGNLITVDHAMLLARLAEAEQNEALKWCLDTQAGSKKPVEAVIKERLKRRNPDPEDADEGDEDDDDLGRRPMWRHEWEPESVQRLKEHIECESGVPLDRAPWPLDADWLIRSAGACLDCPKNTKANAPLFGDLDINVAVCTDGGCFKDKTAVWIEHGIETAKKAAGAKLPILRVSWKATSTAPRMTIGEPCKGPVGLNNFTNVPKLEQVFKDGQWEEATKACEQRRVAVTVDWDDANNRGYMGSGKKLRKPGQIVQACVDPKCKVHPKSYVKSASSGSGHRDAAAEKAKEEKRRQEAIEENKLRMAMASAAIESVKTLPEYVLRTLASRINFWGDDLKIATAILPGFKKTLQTAKVDSAEFVKALSLVSLSELAANEYQGAKFGREEFIRSVRALGYTGPDPWAKPAKPVAKKALTPEAKKRIAAGVKKAATPPSKSTAKKAKKAGKK